MEFAEGVGLDLDVRTRSRGTAATKDSWTPRAPGWATRAGGSPRTASRTCWLDGSVAPIPRRARPYRTELLRWFYAQYIAQVHMPATEEFGVDDSAAWEGVRFSVVEIRDAAVCLSDKGLIRGTGVAEMRGPTHASIMSDGVDCVTDWEGNVAQDLRDQRGYGPTYNGPYLRGDAPGRTWPGRTAAPSP